MYDVLMPWHDAASSDKYQGGLPSGHRCTSPAATEQALLKGCSWLVCLTKPCVLAQAPARRRSCTTC